MLQEYLMDFYGTHQMSLLDVDKRLVIIERPFVTSPSFVKPTLYQVCFNKETSKWEILLTSGLSFTSIEKAKAFLLNSFRKESVIIQLEDRRVLSLLQCLGQSLQNARVIIHGMYFGSLFYKQNNLVVSDVNEVTTLVLDILKDI